ncbi:MAG: type II toxin-antitoxin system death-on-curing family toxin [Bacteroidota bacterium]|nr:type II toxin-antitoxin system death-on-curing family toxin [Bacteroidota bacterium]
MILIEDILDIHKQSIQKYGGSHGVRDLSLLESAIARPFQTFGGEDLYTSIFEKAAALGESLIANHPFIDGNKRTGAVAMIALLEDEDLIFSASQADLYNFVISIATGEIKFDRIVEWLKANTQAL